MRVPVSWLLAGSGVAVLLAAVGAVVWSGRAPRREPPAPAVAAPASTTVATPPPPLPTPAPSRPPVRRATASRPSPSPAAAPVTRPPAPPTTLPLAGSVDRANAALEGRHYPRALAEARAVLGRDPGNSEAQTIAEEAEAALTIEDCLAKARKALQDGDKATAQEILRRGLSINSNEARLMALWREATQ